MRAYRYRMISFSFYDRTGIKAFLEKQARKGWLLDKIGILGWRFRRIEPREIHFAVTYFPDAVEFDPNYNEKESIFQEFCAHAGWQLAAASAQLQIFYNEQDDPVPIETDPFLELETIHKAAKKRFLPVYGILAGLWLIQLLLNLNDFREELIGILSNNLMLLYPFIMLAGIGLCAAHLIGYLLWRRKAMKAAVESGAFLPTRSRRVLSLAIEWLIMICLFASLWSVGGIKTVILGAVLMAGYLLLMVLMQGMRKLLQRMGASPKKNLGISFAAAFVLVFAGVQLGMNPLSDALDAVFPDREPEETYVLNGNTWEIYNDGIPLNLEDLGVAEEIRYSYEYVRSDASVLLERNTYMQRTGEGVQQEAPLYYNVIDVKQDWLVDIILENLREPGHIYNAVSVFGGFFDECREMNPAPWGADAAWQCWDSDDGPMEMYLLRFGSRIVVLNYQEALTQAQMAIVGETFE